MTPPIPVVFSPIFKARPWGGRRLAELLAKPLPDGALIGESWEVSDLPGDGSRVARGPLAGTALPQLIEMWGTTLLGGAKLVDGRFPLLIKFLDARENLSIQLHPAPGVGLRAGSGSPPIKHEAWYVIHADPGSELLIGVKPGVAARDVERVIGTRGLVDLMQPWPARAGQCYFLPSGVIHALGAGIVVAEVQTPSDVTYRVYDWDRVDAQGQPRDLHLADAMAHLCCEVPQELIAQPRTHVGGPFATMTRLVRSECFWIDRLRLSAGLNQPVPYAEPVIWIILSGRGRFVGATDSRSFDCSFNLGDVVLVPAESAGVRVELTDDADVLEVKIPVPSPYVDLPHPPVEPPAGRHPFVELTRP